MLYHGKHTWRLQEGIHRQAFIQKTFSSLAEFPKQMRFVQSNCQFVPCKYKQLANASAGFRQVEPSCRNVEQNEALVSLEKLEEQ